MAGGIYSEAKRYFKHLHLVREDIQQEFILLDLPKKVKRVCDFGCGSGMTTFCLALETEAAECFGIDLFEINRSPGVEELNQYIEAIRNQCRSAGSVAEPFPGPLCRLINEERMPCFQKGNILLDWNLPPDIDLAYCKKLFVNLLYAKQAGKAKHEESLLTGLENITRGLRQDGLLCAIEYDPEFNLEKYFIMSRLRIIRRDQFQRREIRSRGRTMTISRFSLYLCQKTT